MSIIFLKCRKGINKSEDHQTDWDYFHGVLAEYPGGESAAFFISCQCHRYDPVIYLPPHRRFED